MICLIVIITNYYKVLFIHAYCEFFHRFIKQYKKLK